MCYVLDVGLWLKLPWFVNTLLLPGNLNRSDSEILGYALDTLYNIICNDEEEEQGIIPSHNYEK